MADALTYGIELMVGMGCLLGGVAVRSSRMRWLRVLLVVAGVAAVAHALVRLFG